MSATRILTVADVHQHRALLAELASAVERVRPAAVAFVGDLLDSNGSGTGMAGLEECAEQVANLATPELIFVRGNHEEENWPSFASLLRGKGRRIVTLHGECHRVEATGVLGFPCLEGYEDPFLEGREALAADPMEWLPGVIDEHGAPARMIWLMHEPPAGTGLSTADTANVEWATAVRRFQPRLVVSGHDHQTSLRTRRWHAKLGRTVCVNTGQTRKPPLRYAVIECSETGEPERIEVPASGPTGVLAL